MVARGASLVSAAQSSDSGVGDAGEDEEHHFGVGGSGPFDHRPPSTPGAKPTTQGTGGRGGKTPNDSKRH